MTAPSPLNPPNKAVEAEAQATAAALVDAAHDVIEDAHRIALLSDPFNQNRIVSDLVIKRLYLALRTFEKAHPQSCPCLDNHD